MIRYILLLLSLCTIDDVSAIDHGKDVAFIPERDLKGQLDCLSLLAESIKSSEEEYERYIKRPLVKYKLTSEYPKIEECINKFLSDIVELRKLVMKSKREDYFILIREDNNDICISRLPIYRFAKAMLHSLKDLSDKVNQWKSMNNTRVMEDVPMQWFKAHGFVEEDMNDITIDDLSEGLDPLYTDSVPIHRLAYWYVNGYMGEDMIKVIDQFGLLMYTVHNGKYLEDPTMASLVMQLGKGKGAELLNILKELSNDANRIMGLSLGGLLWYRLNNKRVKEGLPLYNNGELTMVEMHELFVNLQQGLPVLENLLRTSTDENWKELEEFFGLQSEIEITEKSRKLIASSIKGMTSENGPLMRMIKVTEELCLPKRPRNLGHQEIINTLNADGTVAAKAPGSVRRKRSGDSRGYYFVAKYLIGLIAAATAITF